VTALRASLDAAMGVGLTAAYAAQLLRWLRVLQREHYQPSAMRLFLGRWSTPQVVSARAVGRSRRSRPITLVHGSLFALVFFVGTRLDGAAVVVTVLYGIVCPWGLGVRGRTSPLQWTRRLRTIAALATTASLAAAVLGTLLARPWLAAVAMVWAVPLVLALAARALGPYENRLARSFVDQAADRLRRVSPRVVAVTGSFGKTSTKNHLAEILAPEVNVVASPRSFNNRAGLSRAINENLADGTQVFVAEMGTYGPGEIHAMCEWCRPELAVITAIGPVHLERMKSLVVIEQAKFEVTEFASTVVLNIDDVRLATWVDRLTGEGKRVRTAGSTNESASVRVRVEGSSWTVSVDGVILGSIPALTGVQPTNVACAVAAAMELGVDVGEIITRVDRVTPVASRSNVVTAPSGVVVIDDTFNANPASGAAALALLASLKLSGRSVVVTPGLIELGSEQYGQNMSLAQKVAAMGAELVVVGRTNAQPLEIGYQQSVRRFDRRERAVQWVRSALIAGDGVLYLNDLPDHYP
jgi:UDP-N-acetylmuramoyl-tripeptide--D-alanyl-D-alanine ligase